MKKRTVFIAFRLLSLSRPKAKKTRFKKQSKKSSLPFGFFRSPDNGIDTMAPLRISRSSLPFGFFRSPDRRTLADNQRFESRSSLPFGFFRSPDSGGDWSRLCWGIARLHCLSASFALPTKERNRVDGIRRCRLSSLPFGFFRSPDAGSISPTTGNNSVFIAFRLLSLSRRQY